MKNYEYFKSLSIPERDKLKAVVTELYKKGRNCKQIANEIQYFPKCTRNILNALVHGKKLFGTKRANESHRLEQKVWRQLNTYQGSNCGFES